MQTISSQRITEIQEPYSETLLKTSLLTFKQKRKCNKKNRVLKY